MSSISSVSTTPKRAYSMAGRDVLAGLGSAVIEARLARMRGPAQDGKPTVVNVFNVEGIKEYQKQDIDLVVHVRNPQNDNRTQVVTIEVKADNYPSGDVEPGSVSDVGNFFFETISNDSKALRTQGCFMYTNSRMLYYLFLPTGTLYQLPTNATRDWFKQEMGYTDNWYNPTQCDLHELRKKDARWRYTSTEINGKIAYNTWGVVLPIKQVLRDVRDAKGRTIQKQDVLEDVIRVAHARGVLHFVWEKMPEKTRTRAAAFLQKHGLEFAPAASYATASPDPTARVNMPERRIEVWNLEYHSPGKSVQPRQMRWSNWTGLRWSAQTKVFEFRSERGLAGVLTRAQMDVQFPGMTAAFDVARSLGLQENEVVSHMKNWWHSRARNAENSAVHASDASQTTAKA